MERAPKSEDILDFEQTAYGVWEHIRDAAPEEAETLIAGIEGFENMDPKEKLLVLQNHLGDLSNENNPNFNSNRALVEEIARRMRAIEGYNSTSGLLSPVRAGRVVNEKV